MNYYNEIKSILVDNAIGKKVREYKSNQKDLESYYNVGKLLVEAQGGEEKAKYGNELMKEYSKKLTNELGKGYSVRMLQKMRQFYLLTQKSPPMAAKFKSINITWSNICEIMQLKNLEEIEYYLNLSNKLCLTKLDSKIKEKLLKQEEVSVKDKIPDPIVLEGLEYKEKLTEKVVQKWIDENPASFCKSLGEGYSYIESQYKIKIGSRTNRNIYELC